MDQAQNKNMVPILILAAAVPLLCITFGLLFIGGSFYYLDCSREGGQVNCEITTRFLRTFITEKRTASDVSSAVQGEKCDQGNCQYRIELRTASGIEPLTIDYIGANPDAIFNINAYLNDLNRQSFHTIVTFWNTLLISIASTVIGLVGMVVWVRSFKKIKKKKSEWPELLEPGEGQAHELPESLTIPKNLRMQKDINELIFRYHHPTWKGLTWLIVGVGMAGLGWIIEYFKHDVIFPIIFSIVGVVMIYIGLATLINRLSIQVTCENLISRYAPIPYRCNCKLSSNDIKQLYIHESSVYSSTGEQRYFLLEAILQNNQQATLAAEIPYDVLHFLEIHIESYLGIKNRSVIGEFKPDS